MVKALCLGLQKCSEASGFMASSTWIPQWETAQVRILPSAAFTFAFCFTVLSYSKFDNISFCCIISITAIYYSQVLLGQRYICPDWESLVRVLLIKVRLGQTSNYAERVLGTGTTVDGSRLTITVRYTSGLCGYEDSPWSISSPDRDASPMFCLRFLLSSFKI